MDPGFREHGAAHLAGPERERCVLERLLHLPCGAKSQKSLRNLGFLGLFPKKKKLRFEKGGDNSQIGAGGLIPIVILGCKGEKKNI